MNRFFFFIAMSVSLLMPFSATAESTPFLWESDNLASSGTVPKAAAAIASQLDKQLTKRIGDFAGGKNSVSIAITVPVFLSNLNQSSPLARQMAEEITTLLVQAGYFVDDIRKGNDIVMEEGVGEMILTRNLNRLASRDSSTAAVLAGTYTVTGDNVRFNIKLLHTPSNQVLAMASATVPVTDELFPLLADRGKRPYMPSVGTRLN